MTTISLPIGPHETLAGDYVPGSVSPEFALLWVHGFGSHRGGEKAVAMRETCMARGWSFAAFDFRGHGGSTGTMHELRVSRLLDDLAAIAAWLQGRGHTRLGLVASSMGGFAASWFTVRRPELISGCVLVAPAFGFLERPWERLTDSEREKWRKTDRFRVKNDWVDTEISYGLLEERDQFRPYNLAAAWKTPALLFHGLDDDVVPDSDSLAFIHQTTFADVELRLLKAGDHRMTAFKDVIARESIRFFERVMSDRSAGGV